MRITRAACASALLVAATSLAQSRAPDLSGRWQLVEPTRAERALDTLAIDAPDELRASIEARDASFIGTQLVLSRGVRPAVASGSMWRIATPGRLIIEFSEVRPGERPKIAVRVYAAAATAPTTPPRGGAP